MWFSHPFDLKPFVEPGRPESRMDRFWSSTLGEVWSLEPRADGQNVVWWVSELGKSFTSAELASQMAIRLVKQFEVYEQAFG